MDFRGLSSMGFQNHLNMVWSWVRSSELQRQTHQPKMYGVPPPPSPLPTRSTVAMEYFTGSVRSRLKIIIINGPPYLFIGAESEYSRASASEFNAVK